MLPMCNHANHKQDIKFKEKKVLGRRTQGQRIMAVKDVTMHMASVCLRREGKLQDRNVRFWRI